MDKQMYKYVITHSIMFNDKSKEDGFYESGEDFMGVYDTLEDAQEGIRKAWAWQEERSKETWQKDGITYVPFNFTFDTIKSGLENNEVAQGLKDRVAVVNFKTSDPNKVFDWEYSIRQIPYMPY